MNEYKAVNINLEVENQKLSKIEALEVRLENSRTDRQIRS
jgi:hypothetical protein